MRGRGHIANAQCAGQFQGRIIIGDRLEELPHLQVSEPAAVEGIDIVRLQPVRLVAIRQRSLQIADDRARPAAAKFLGK